MNPTSETAHARNVAPVEQCPVRSCIGASDSDTPCRHLPASVQARSWVFSPKQALLALLLFLCFFSNAQTPGGVAGVSYWYKADAGASGTAWTDQSGNGYGLSGTCITNNGASANAINYNPVQSFNGTSHLLSTGAGIMPATAVVGGTPNQASYLCVYRQQSGTVGCALNYSDGFSAWIVGVYGSNLYVLNRSMSLGAPTAPNVYLRGLAGDLNTGFSTLNNAATTGSMTGSGTSLYNSSLSVGAQRSGVLHNSMDFAELIGYPSTLSAANYQKIQSYLSIKYSMHLTSFANAGSQNYLNSAGATIYSAASHSNKIIGIGRDNESGLLQKQSRTDDDSLRLYVSTLATSNLGNGGTITNTLSTVVMGADAGLVCVGANATELPTGFGLSRRLEREWKVTKTNFSDNFSIDIRLNASALTNSVAVANLRLLVDDDGDFSNGGTSIYSNGDGSGIAIAYSNPVITVSGISATHIPATGTRYITIVLSNIPTPGGVPGVSYWYKADAGASNTAWTDQSGNGYDLSGTCTTNNGASANAINYNLVQSFNGTSHMLNTGAGVAMPAKAAVNPSSPFQTSYLLVYQQQSGTAGCTLNYSDGTSQWVTGVYGSNLYVMNRSMSLGTTTASTVYLRGLTGDITSCFSTLNSTSTTGSMTGSGGNPYNSSLFIGAQRSGVLHNPMDFAELIGYSSTLSAANYQKIQSYLSIKYSMHLTSFANAGSQNYLNSAGTTIYSAASHSNKIIGIGRDNESGLLQKQSRTDDDSLRLYVSTLATSNLGNGGTITNTLSTVVMGADAGRLCAGANNTERPPGCGLIRRLEREWKVTKTNFSDNFSIDIRLNGCALTNSVTIAHLRLLVDDDGDFSNATCYSNGDGTGLTITYANPIVTISDISATHIPNGTRYITIGSTNILTPLPVEIVSFSGKCDEASNAVHLNWTTASEKNNDYFRIERSPDAMNWQSIARVPGAGDSYIMHTYSYVDNDRQNYGSETSTLYYRLTQVNTDHTNTVFPQLVASELCELPIPNPVWDHIYISNSQSYTTYRIMNQLGQPVKQGEIESSLISLTGLAEGLYYLELTTRNGKQRLEKLIVARK